MFAFDLINFLDFVFYFCMVFNLMNTVNYRPEDKLAEPFLNE